MTQAHQDSEGRVIASGGAVVRKEHSYSEFKEVQWTVNQTNGFVFNNTSRILKFELRRSQRNERIEDVILEWDETNPTGVDVTKLPTFWNCVDSIRVPRYQERMAGPPVHLLQECTRPQLQLGLQDERPWTPNRWWTHRSHHYPCWGKPPYVCQFQRHPPWRVPQSELEEHLPL